MSTIKQNEIVTQLGHMYENIIATLIETTKKLEKQCDEMAKNMERMQQQLDKTTAELNYMTSQYIQREFTDACRTNNVSHLTEIMSHPYFNEGMSTYNYKQIDNIHMNFEVWKLLRTIKGAPDKQRLEEYYNPFGRRVSIYHASDMTA